MKNGLIFSAFEKLNEGAKNLFHKKRRDQVFYYLQTESNRGNQKSPIRDISAAEPKKANSVSSQTPPWEKIENFFYLFFAKTLPKVFDH